MRLTDLDPHFISEVHAGGHREDQVGLPQAQGVRLLCPRCYQANGGAAGTHSVIVPFKDRGVPDDAYPGMARWAVDPASTGFENLTTTPSILLLSGCKWHGFITSGEVSII